MIFDYIEIKTIGDLKEFIKDLPEEEEVFLFNGGTAYPANLFHGEMKSCEHNTRHYMAKGLIIGSESEF